MEVQTEYAKSKTAVEGVQRTRVRRGDERSKQTRTEVALSLVLSQAPPLSPRVSSIRQNMTEAVGLAAAASTDSVILSPRSLPWGQKRFVMETRANQRYGAA